MKNITAPLAAKSNDNHNRSRRMGLLAATLALGLAGASGGCMVSVEAEVPDVQVTQHDVAFTGIPGATALGDVSTAMTFTQSRPNFDLPTNLDSTVQALKVDLVAKSGVTNFDFLKALRITMTPQGATDAIELINYEKAAGTTVGGTLEIPSRNPVNILDQWKADSATFTVELDGTLPEQSWSVDISVHFGGKVSYKY